MNKIEIIQTEEYTGTMESLESVVEKLNLESQNYHFDVKTKRLYIHTMGLMLMPGNHFHYNKREYELKDQNITCTY